MAYLVCCISKLRVRGISSIIDPLWGDAVQDRYPIKSNRKVLDIENEMFLLRHKIYFNIVSFIICQSG